MPNKKKYDAIKANPKRLASKRNYNSKWIKNHKGKHPFVNFSKKCHYRRKTEIPPFEFWKLAKRQKLICPLTGRKLTGETMSIDHIIPLCKGGKDDISNIQLVHVDANYAKRVLLETDFIKLCHDVCKMHPKNF
jgi:5-methylcytosine-specific restriction protein A